MMPPEAGTATALVTGVGPGTGEALVRRFVKGGYSVAMVARNEARLDSLDAELDGAHAFPCDLSDAAALRQTCDAVRAKLGAPRVLIHNAVGGAFGTFLEVDPAVLRRNFEVNVMAFYELARLVAPPMVDAGEGAILATGNTSAFRGKANFAAFAPTKAAQRILAEAIARDLGPKGVHVSYLMIDAVIDGPVRDVMGKGKADDFFCKPADIADQAWSTVHQPRSAWSFNVEVRPFGEVW